MKRSPRDLEKRETLNTLTTRMEEQVASVLDEVFKDVDDDEIKPQTNYGREHQKLTENQLQPNFYEDFFPNKGMEPQINQPHTPQIFINSKLYMNNNDFSPEHSSMNNGPPNKKFLHSMSLSPDIHHRHSKDKNFPRNIKNQYVPHMSLDGSSMIPRMDNYHSNEG